MERRQLRLASLGLFGTFVALRVVLAVRNPIHIFNGEELIHLRLAQQLAADMPLGNLSQYAYGDGRGLNGGGSLVLSGLYVLLVPVLGEGQLVLRTMALLWASAGALLAAALGRRLFGPYGSPAALAALLCMPPSYAIHSTVAWGNHAEGGVLVLGCFLLFLRASEAPDSLFRALFFGLGLGFSTWFWPPAAIATLPLLLIFVVTHRSGIGTLAALLGGAVLSSSPWLTVTFDTSHLAATGGLPEAGSTAFGFLLQPSSWLPLLSQAAIVIPVYEVDWAERWTPGGTLSGPVALALTWLSWLAVAALPLRVLRGTSLQVKLLGFTLPLISIGLPLALVVAEAAVPRRLTPVYLLWSLALASPLALLAAPGRVSKLRRGIALVVVLGGMTPSWLLALSGSPPTLPYKAELYALCRADVPVLASGTCVRDLSEAHLPLLHRLDVDPRAQSNNARNAGLLGFDAATGHASNFALDRQLAPCPAGNVGVPELSLGTELDLLAWEYFGAALAVSCGSNDALRRCQNQAAGRLLRSCRSGVEWSSARP